MMVSTDYVIKVNKQIKCVIRFILRGLFLLIVEKNIFTKANIIDLGSDHYYHDIIITF